MPSETFFHLPEAKRNRVIGAAWEEFTKFSYSDVSINRIILKAHIPRGSFYQYFLNKADLFQYLCGDLFRFYFDVERNALQITRGDLFTAMLNVYDEIVQTVQEQPLPIQRLFKLCQLNPGMNLIHSAIPNLSVPPTADLSQFRWKDPESVNYTVLLLRMTVVTAIVAAFSKPEDSSTVRRALPALIETIKYGCLVSRGPNQTKEEPNHETKTAGTAFDHVCHSDPLQCRRYG